MIKYAKTKDGKIVKINLEFGEEVFTSRYEIVGELRNTIEELCDILLVVNDTTGKVVKQAKKIEPDNYKWQKNSFTVYGAIWIKGEYGEPILKTVGKLNEDIMKLELLNKNNWYEENKNEKS